MSWLFSQALEEGFSEGISSDGKPFARLNEIDMPLRSWLKDKTTDSFVLSRSGMTFARLTQSHGEELLTSFRAASRAKISPLPELDSGCPESVPDSGGSSLVLLAIFDRDSSSWKTLQRSLVEDWTSSSPIFGRSGMMRHGSLWALPTSELLTSETGFGFSGRYLTPSTIDSGSRFNRFPSEGATLRPTLGAMVKFNLWPTPVASEGKDCGSTWEALARHDKGCRLQRRMATLGLAETQPTEKAALNPSWVEWLMGWPIGWTDCVPLGTDKFRSWQRSHGASSDESLIENDSERPSPRINSPSNNPSESEPLPSRARALINV